MNTDESNAQIFESVKKSLTQNRNNLSEEDLEVVKCVFAALVVSTANSPLNSVYTAPCRLLLIAKTLGLLTDLNKATSGFPLELKKESYV